MPDSHPAAGYDPQPVDTSAVQLAPELTALLESLAENAHDAWARQRIHDGWTYGPARNDETKEHPCLVPYADLPEHEREYDRVMARETLKFILSHGYRVVPPVARPTAARDDSVAASESATRSHAEIAAASHTRRLIEIWSTHDDDVWARHPDLSLGLARRLINCGEPFLAHDVLRQAGAAATSDPMVRYLEGLTLARGGATLHAQRIARELSVTVTDASPRFYEDVFGLLGRTSKELALADTDPEQRRAWLAQSFEAYLHAFERTGGSYPGINAATVALLMGEVARSTSLAKAVRDIALAELRAAGSDPGVWTLATLGEAALLLGDVDDAKRRYAEAARAGGAGWGDIASARRQARLVCETAGLPADWLDAVLRIPTVVVFAGHRIDEPGRTPPRFPPEAEDRVRAAIKDRLIAVDAGFGFSGAANGADILFQEAMRDSDIDGETFVVLPYSRDEYLETSVAGAASGDWSRRFDQVMSRAAEPVVATGQRSVDLGVLYDYAHVLLLGHAALQARAIETRVVPMVLWDGKDGAAFTGTAAAAAAWRRAGHSVEVLDLRAIVAGEGSPERTV